MGCDIHFYVEKKIDGKWVSQDIWSKEDPLENEETSFLYVDHAHSYYKGRNYNLFSILADVRNGFGFAGVKTGEKFSPIAPPRGVPEDSCIEIKKVVDQWEGDGHSHSYFNLKELLEYDWSQVSHLQGWVCMPVWSKWVMWDRQNGKGPQSYCGFVDGPLVTRITAQEADALFPKELKWEDREKIASENANKYALAKWTQPYYAVAGSFFSETIPRLLALSNGVTNFENVRVVFFFDN